MIAFAVSIMIFPWRWQIHSHQTSLINVKRMKAMNKRIVLGSLWPLCLNGRISFQKAVNRQLPRFPPSLQSASYARPYGTQAAWQQQWELGSCCTLHWSGNRCWEWFVWHVRGGGLRGGHLICSTITEGHSAELLQIVHRLLQQISPLSSRVVAYMFMPATRLHCPSENENAPSSSLSSPSSSTQQRLSKG